MQAQTMRAVVISRFGGPEVLESCDLPIPQPGAGQVLIKVAYAGVNFAELMARRGEYHALPTPFTPGYEVSGTIAALGTGVEGFRPGQPVAALTIQGGYAQFATAQAVLTFPLDAPGSSIDLEQAAAFPAVAPTAYDLLANAARIRQGESVLIHAASGGVGIAAGQLARALGARLVLGTVSSEEKAVYARPFGYDQVFPVEGFEQAVLEATGGKGVDIALDARGEPTRSQNLALAWVLAQPAITSAILGASRPEQLDQTLPAVDLVLDKQVLAACDDVWYQLPRERDLTIAFR